MAFFGENLSPQREVRWHVLLAFLFALSLFFAVPWSARADQVTFGWNPNSEGDLAGYRLYLGGATRNYTQSIDVGDVTSYTVTLTAGQQYYVALTAYNAGGLESDFSAEATYPPLSPVSASLGGATGASSGGGGGGGGGCFIATALYGGDSREVAVLRQFRDHHMLTNRVGSELVALYYRYSPPVARVLRRSPVLRVAGRGVIGPIVFAVAHSYLVLSLICALAVFTFSRKRARKKR